MSNSPAVRHTRPADTPMNVRCGDCGHVYAPLYLPMPMDEAALILKRVRCPSCDAGTDRQFVHTPR